MVRSSVQQCLVGILVLSARFLASAPAGAQQPAEYDQTLARVIRLLPRPPDKVVVVDADTSGKSFHDKLQHVEGFATYGQRVVYLVRQSDTLQRAMKGPGIFDYALAIIIWHEMAHIDGADEATARRAEEQLWAEFVLAGRVDRDRGMKYLALLKSRR
jgi:hypothetical protein